MSVVLVQEEAPGQDVGVQTILGLLRDQMEEQGQGARRRSRMSIKQRLGLRSLGCCGGMWTTGDEEHQEEEGAAGETPTPAAASSMNLAAALAAERLLRERNQHQRQSAASNCTWAGSTLRVSLMRLLEETAEGGLDDGGGGGGNDTVCCVCMIRKKGAAFIPCGHTYCRVCSRELWLNRGSCPLCNRSILEILDIF